MLQETHLPNLFMLCRIWVPISVDFAEGGIRTVSVTRCPGIESVSCYASSLDARRTWQHGIVFRIFVSLIMLG